MILIENTEVSGFEAAIRGMRNPLNSWDKSDSGWEGDKNVIFGDKNSIPVIYGDEYNYLVGPKDHELMMNLAMGGPVHGKYCRMIWVTFDVTAPLYWWKEFDTYRVGRADNPTDIEMNSCSTMHKIQAKEFEWSDFSVEHLSNFGVWSGPEFTEHDAVYAPAKVMACVIQALNGAREQFLKRQDKIYWWQMIQLLPSSYNQKRTVMLSYEVLVGMFKWRRNHKLDEWKEFCDWITTLPLSGLITREES